jgi:hypothetical protein
MLRVLRVDDMSPGVFFCDNELQVFFAEINNLFPWQDIPRSLHDVATGLQKCFLSRPLTQTLCDKISEAQKEICYYLRKEIEYFQGKETQVFLDWPLEGPGAFTRKFISLVLALLQTYPAEVCVDTTGTISIGNSKYQSSHHIVSILSHGVEFDFRGTNITSSLFVKWEEFVSLTLLGISFVLKEPQEVPLPGRFTDNCVSRSVAHACTKGPITKDLSMCSLEKVGEAPDDAESDMTAVKRLMILPKQGQGEPGWTFIDWHNVSRETQIAS